VSFLGIFGRGLAMGIAEVVPGVSGGTIAFVTGIYYELVNTLAGFGPQSLRVLFHRGPLQFWHHHNLNFLSLLMLGMLVAMLGFARIVGHLLEVVPTVVWGFFFGLIVASVAQIGRGRPWAYLLTLGALGCVAGIALANLDPLQAHGELWVYFVGGVIAISAWMLPAISGSFMLLTLGLYHSVIAALNNWQWSVLLSLAFGCLVGMLLFSRLLAWLMTHHRDPLLALLTGFMAGSLIRLWPWNVEGTLLTPTEYSVALGQDPMVLGTCLAALAGGGVLWLLSRLE
jgi:putative membrane protein